MDSILSFKQLDPNIPMVSYSGLCTRLDIYTHQAFFHNTAASDWTMPTAVFFALRSVTAFPPIFSGVLKSISTRRPNFNRSIAAFQTGFS